MSLPERFICLSKSETVPGRPFTDPERNAEDLVTLEYIAKRLRYVLSQAEAIRQYPSPLLLYLPEPGGLRLRITITNPDELRRPMDLTVVGFCGQKRPDVDRSQLDGVDLELISEFLEHPHLLSYNSLQLKEGNWCNLVLFSHPQGIMHWAHSAKHAHAASQLAPQYYLAIRLHNGLLPGGLMSGHNLTLTRTKYYDYKDRVTWQAMRELQPV